MKRIVYLLFIVALLSSCKTASSNREIISYFSSDDSVEINHSYEEIESMKISWNLVFSMAKTSYFVYFYSKNCSHCSQIKNDIIDYALKQDNFYFVEDGKEIVFVDETEKTIGVNNIENFGILGFPSLIKIENQICVLNITGVDKIYLQLSL